VLGLVVANLPFGPALIELKTEHIDLAWLGLDLSAGHWISDGLLAVFFFIVAVELRRELVIGELNSLSKALLPAIAAVGGVVHETDAPGGRNLAGWVADQLQAAGLSVDGRARTRIVEVLGEDAGALVGLIEVLKGAFGPDVTLGPDDIEPFLGPAGGVAPWDLTDAIDAGDVAVALDRLERMMGAGGRHPLAIMATLQSHYTRMMRLDGAGARGEKDAAQVLGLKGSTFPAKKALTQSQRLGGAGVRRAVGLLAEADVDLRGARAWPGELVMEVLVARLARLAR
jgi:DNA polymerase-3 subunit delta